MRLIRIVFPLAVVAMLGAACGGGGDGGGGDGDGAVATDTLTHVDNAFQPQQILVDPGSTVTVRNDGLALHNLTVENTGIDVDLQSGESTTVDAPSEPGDYAMSCNYHPEMSGTLTVE